MAEAAEVDKTKKQGRGADTRRVLALLLFFALLTSHSSPLFAKPLSHVRGAMVQVTSAWMSNSSTRTLASNPAQGDLVVAAFATFGGTNSGPSPITATAASGNSCAVISIPAAMSQAASSGLCSGCTAAAVSGGAESPFSADTGALIPRDTVMETNTANDAVSRGRAAIRGVAENLLAYDSTTAGSFVTVQHRHSFVVLGRTKPREAPKHKDRAQTSLLSKSAVFPVPRGELRNLSGRDSALRAHEAWGRGRRQRGEKPLTRHAPADDSAGA
ncbi:MAG: hypothetical protein ABSH52_17995 [Terriglobia bacterium]